MAKKKNSKAHKPTNNNWCYLEAPYMYCTMPADTVAAVFSNMVN